MNPRLTNQFTGMNPHLLGELLAHEGWKGFHNVHVGVLAEYLDRQVYPMGYRAVPETSLQMYYVDDDEEWRKAGKRYPDVGLQSIEPRLHGSSPTSAKTATKPTWKQTLSDSEDVELSAIALRAAATDKSGRVDPLVAWIELLSPGNKPGESNYEAYMGKREQDALGTGATLIEIDYLYQQAPIVPWLPEYGEAWENEDGSGVGKPFYVLMETRRPQHEKSWFDFEIEQPMPVVKIPLLKGDNAYLELGRAYNTTLERNFAGLINYLQKPLYWDTYLARDQDQIAARIETVYEGMKNGKIREGNKQEGPLPITREVPGARHHLDRFLATLDLDREQGLGLDT